MAFITSTIDMSDTEADNSKAPLETAREEWKGQEASPQGSRSHFPAHLHFLFIPKSLGRGSTGTFTVQF